MRYPKYKFIPKQINRDCAIDTHYRWQLNNQLSIEIFCSNSNESHEMRILQNIKKAVDWLIQCPWCGQPKSMHHPIFVSLASIVANSSHHIRCNCVGCLHSTALFNMAIDVDWKFIGFGNRPLATHIHHNRKWFMPTDWTLDFCWTPFCGDLNRWCGCAMRNA